MKIISHRGNGNGKENTKNAILKSLNKKYIDGVEFDIRFTKDKNFVINHNKTYKGKIISKENTKELKKLGLNTLKEVLKKINTNKIIMIEIKDKEESQIKYLNKILKKYKLNYYICSFNKIIEKINYKKGYITYIDKTKIDKLDFNSINHNLKINTKKETFVWTINKHNYHKTKYNIITDNPLEIYKKLN